MPGERYFAIRDRLLDCYERIETLAGSVGVKRREGEGRARAELARAFRLVVLGEVNAGKSSLLNAIAGVELCEVGPLPTTRETVWYCHNGVGADGDHEGGWREAGRPLAFLKGFELIDTPGTNGDRGGELERDLERLTEADVVMVVFPADNTWTAATWSLLEKFSDEALGRGVLVVQQADRKSDEDLRVIRGHMNELAEKKLGRRLPIFAVAAARVREGDAGLVALREHITERVCHSPEREHLLRYTAQRAGGRLRQVEEALDAQRRAMDDDGFFLGSLEREAEQLRDRVLETSPKTLAGARGRYEGEVMRLSKSLGLRLGAMPTLYRLLVGDSTPIKVEGRFAEHLQEAIRDFGVQDAERLLDECGGHWEEVRPRVEERMGVDPGESRLAGEGREEAVARFAEQVGKAVPVVLGQLRVRASLDAPLRRRNRQLKWLVAASLLLMIAAGLAGTFGFSQPAWWILGGGVLLVVVTLLHAWLSGRRVVGGVRERLLDSRGRFESALRDDYARAVRELFHEHSNGLLEVRRRLAGRRADFEPQLQWLDQLYLELKAIEQELP